jgi:hypothetical protein
MQNAPLVKRIDHIAIQYNSSTEVDSMYNLFRNKLNLVTWFEPGIRKPYGKAKFYNTGFYLGNVFLEFITFQPQNRAGRNFPTCTKHIFAYTNEIDNTLEVLDSLNIKHSDYLCFAFDCTSQRDTLFTNILISGLQHDYIYNIFCRFHPELFDCKNAFNYGELPILKNPELQHDYYLKKHREKNGGNLGITELQKMVIQSNTYAEDRSIYENLYYPAQIQNDKLWKLKHGPSMEIVEGPSNKIQSLHIKVLSMRRAQEFLMNNNLGYVETDDKISLNIGKNMNLNFYLVE